MMNMFREVLRTQWKWSWGVVLLSAIAAFSVPILSVQGALVVNTGLAADDARAYTATQFLTAMERWGALYTIVAACLGLGLAMLAWAADHRGKHVYSLVLPVERWRLVLMRFGSGSVLLLVPVVALAAGATLAVASTSVPDGLTAYPIALTLRFALAALVAFALFFAISSGTTRTAAFVLAPIAGLVAVDVLLAAMGLPLNLLEGAATALLDWPGVLEVFTGRWLLIDV
jgi:hypothetical protein